MFSLRIGTEPLDLGDNTALNLVFVNPAFDQSALGRAFAFPLSLPATPRNLALLSHPNRLDTRRAARRYNCELWVGENFYERGVLELTSARPAVMEVTFKNRERDLLETLGNIRLRDIMPTVSIPQDVEPYFELVFGDTTLDPAIVFINGETFNAGTGLQATVMQEMRDLLEAAFPLASITQSGNIVRIEPGFQYDPFVVFYTDGSSISAGTVTNIADSIHQNFLAYVADVRATPAEWGSFTVVYTPFFYRKGKVVLNSEYDGFVNWHFETNPGENPLMAAADTGFPYNYVPFVSAKYVLDMIATEAGIGAYLGDFYTSTDFEQLRVWNNRALDNVREDAWPDAAETFLNCHVQAINLAEHVPDITALEFVQGLMALENQYMVYRGDNNIEIRPKLEQISSPALDWREYYAATYKLVPKVRRGVLLDYVEEPLEPLDTPAAYGAGELVTRVPGTLIENMTTLRVADTATEGKFCVTWMQGQSDAYDLPPLDFKLRFFFDRGEDTCTVGGFTYLRSASRTEDTAGDPSGAWSLYITDDAAGIYARRYKRWLELSDRDTVEAPFVLPAADALRMRTWRNGRVRLYDPQGAPMLVVKSLEVQIRGDVYQEVLANAFVQ